MIFKDKKLSEITFSGWGNLEGDFIWSISKYASLLVPIKKQSKSFGLQFVVEPFVNQELNIIQDIEIFCNGIFILGQTSSLLKQEILFVEIHHSLSNFEALKLDFRFPTARSPKEMNLSTDERILGFKLFEFQLIN
jgi:hypothetical protein